MILCIISILSASRTSFEIILLFWQLRSSLRSVKSNNACDRRSCIFYCHPFHVYHPAQDSFLSKLPRTNAGQSFAPLLLAWSQYHDILAYGVKQFDLITFWVASCKLQVASCKFHLDSAERWRSMGDRLTAYIFAIWSGHRQDQLNSWVHSGRRS